MSKYQATVRWSRNGQEFGNNRYSRAHLWSFDGGVNVRASSSPQVVPPPMSVSDAVDPEEAFVAALSSCHMLWFLSIAATKGHSVDAYDDTAEGVMGKDADNRMAIVKVVLRPHVTFTPGNGPTALEHQSLHEEAHRNCFIAASVKSAVEIELA